MKKIDIIVPCYNEDAVLELFYEKTTEVIRTVENYEFQFVFVDDGSRDGTYQKMKELANINPQVRYLSFSKNFGKEAAMYAGLTYSDGEYVIVMDADLQHPPELIPKMIAEVEKGVDCCAAQRIGRKGESRVRSFFSRQFYKISNRFTDVNLVQGAVDYRIMSRRMVDAVLSMSERQRFSKGIFAWVGFTTVWLPYENVERTAGSSKWNFWSLFKYAMDGITAFSVTPLRTVTFIGGLISLFSFIYIAVTLVKTFIYGIDVPGYVTLLCAVLFLGGIIELSLGVLGEYVAHIYVEIKGRPIFILKDMNFPLTKELHEDEK